LIEADSLPTGDLGSRTVHNFEYLKTFQQQFSNKWPVKCMESWDGWFNRWGEPVSKRDSDVCAVRARDAVYFCLLNISSSPGCPNCSFVISSCARGT
ncbi:beta-galactosidase, partial [Staphylococcus pseudintermedius]